ncbi:MAG TPA: prolyl oligopeptidase family serine peptidase [Clostridia bacterium]|nr:prolyl oligopeptidase family serine peptidase [Clostridia bacterium]
MQHLTILGTATAFLALACLCSVNAAEPGPTKNQLAKEFKFTATQTAKVNYLLYLPEGYDADPAKRWPLMLFLHGAGERGTNIWKVAVHGPPKHAAVGSNFPFIVVSPQCPEGQRWSNEVLLGLLDEVTGAYRVDTTRIYLTGLSMGGYGTWNLGCSYPEKFAAIVPICGGGEKISILLASRERSQALRSLGVWAFHGAKDPVVPLEESQRMVDALRQVGVRDVKFTVYPEANHDSWTETYQNPELYEWLLKHQRQPVGK